MTPNLPSFKRIDWSLLDVPAFGLGEGWGAGASFDLGLERLRDAARAAAGDSTIAVRGMAEMLAFQQDAAVAVVAGFAEGEVKRIKERASRQAGSQ